jgi:hypothetical protein
MQFADVKARLDDLPRSYTRLGPNYQTFDTAQTAALFRYTNASDGVMNQLNFTQAVGPWLDAWGKLFGIARNTNEADDTYQNRITYTLLAGRCTPNAILIYLQTLGITATIEEDFVNCSFALQFTAPLTTAAFTSLAQNMASVRPAGVPFLPFQVLQGGLYVGTVDFLNAPKVTGAYLDQPLNSFTPSISESTDNSVPLLPTLWLSDPTLNPGLVVSGAA